MKLTLVKHSNVYDLVDQQLNCKTDKIVRSLRNSLSLPKKKNLQIVVNVSRPWIRPHIIIQRDKKSGEYRYKGKNVGFCSGAAVKRTLKLMKEPNTLYVRFLRPVKKQK
jgi:hypothetical protein